MANFWTTKGVVMSSWTWTSLSPLVTAFSLFSFMVAIHVTKKAKLKKKKKEKKRKEKKDGRYLLRRVVSLCARFSVEGIGPSPQAAR